MDKNIINYGQCWEDPEVLVKALKINTTDNVLSVTSGGDNTITLLLYKPKKITSVDFVSGQNYLLELKLTATKVLTYDEYLSLLGVTNSFNRHNLFLKVKPLLNSKTELFWSNRYSVIKKGIIHSGRFEKFLNIFRKYLLPLVHSNKIITQFLNVSSLEEQRRFYKNHWNTRKWRTYFRLATSSYILKYLARQKGMFKYTKMKLVSNDYLNRLELNLYNVRITENYFLHYCLTGTFEKVLPPYLQEKIYTALKNTQNSDLSIISNDVLSHLKSMPDNSYTKFNLSDIFEALSDDEINNVWEEIIRVAKNGATIVYWDNLLPRPVPSRFSDIVKVAKQLEEKLFQKDRVFFYRGLHIYKIIKWI